MKGKKALYIVYMSVVFLPRISLPFRVSTGPNTRVNACSAGGGCKRVRGSLTKARSRYRCRFLSTRIEAAAESREREKKNRKPQPALDGYSVVFPSHHSLRVFFCFKVFEPARCQHRVMRSVCPTEDHVKISFRLRFDWLSTTIETNVQSGPLQGRITRLNPHSQQQRGVYCDSFPRGSPSLRRRHMLHR